MSSLCTYALRRVVNPHSQSFFSRLTLNNRKAALINCVRHTEWTQSPAAFHRFSPASTQLVDPPQKTENQSSLHKWLRKSLLFLSCGFGAYVFKSSLHYASCFREDEIKQDMLVDDKWKGINIKLFQYQTCPFCSKTRFFMRAHNIPFEDIEVHPIFKKETKRAKSKKVPVVFVEKDGEVLEIADSSLIMSVLSSYLVNDNLSITEIMKLYPHTTQIDDDGKKKDVILNKYWLIHDEEYKPAEVADGVDPRKEEAQWRAWTDDYLVHLISPNVYRTLREAYQAFDHHVSLGRFQGTWEGVIAKYGGAVAMWAISKRLKKKYNISENVRIDLYKACNTWVEAIGKHRKFMGGDKPNLADISVFGVLWVMEGLDCFEEVLTHSKIKKWYYRTKQAIEEHNGQKLIPR
ncbi:unnamed protein product [Clavelina lepadiformis]|uniref:Glutaredoxin domain-containing protein n=1 Tax=Clavelina lepadiformis TaxID=159417 RepID=A0ABP0GAL8_CLALP